MITLDRSVAHLSRSAARLALALALAPALACGAALAAPGPARVAALATVQPPVRQLNLEAHKGTLIRLPQPASTVFVADPSIADVQVKSPLLIYLYGKAPGETVLYAVDSGNRVLLASTVVVVRDLTALRRALRTVLPATPITVTPVGKGVMLSGNVADAADAATAMSLAKRVVDAKGDVIDHLKVTGPDQVNLRVRIAEVSRTVIKDLGFNWSGGFGVGANPLVSAVAPFANPLCDVPGSPCAANGAFNIANGASSFVNPGNTPVGGEKFGFGQFSGQNQYAGLLEALSNNGLAQVLAEPNLTALSGHQASFLAGGEFPIPVPQSSGSGGAPVITILFKKFGVQLTFTPTILSSNRISLTVRPEVSELSQVGSITLAGYTVPGITTRQAETTVELASGQSFAIAGLLQNNMNENVAKFPGLGDLPVLGALFRSDSFQRNQSELVVIVTPYVVRPSSRRLLVPTDGLVAPNDIERIFDGMNYHREPAGVGFPPPVAVPSGLKGPIGFQLE